MVLKLVFKIRLKEAKIIFNQTYMHQIQGDLEFVIIFIDDICIFSVCLKDHNYIIRFELKNKFK